MATRAAAVNPGRARRARCAASSTSTPRRCSSPRASCSTTRAQAAGALRRTTKPGIVYSRFTNPTVSMFQDRLAALEGARGLRRHRLRHVGDPRHRDGRSSRPAITSCARTRCSARRSSSSATILGRFGVETTFVSPTEVRGMGERAARPNTQLFFLETPSNPLTEVSDIAALARVAKKAGALLAVDNVFCTPGAAAAARARRRPRDPLGDQVSRRAGPGARRRGARPKALVMDDVLPVPAHRRPDARRRSTPGCC